MPSHLVCVNEDYLTHLLNGLSYSYVSLYASMVFFVHAIVPDVFTSEGSDTIFSLSEHLRKRLYKIQIRKREERTYEDMLEIL